MSKVVPYSPPKDLLVEDLIKIKDINDEFIRQPGLIAWVTELHAQSKRRVSQLKAEYELEYSELRRIFRDKNSGKRTTKDEVDDWVVTRKNYKQKQTLLIDAEYEEHVLAGIVKALDHKRDSLVGLGANKRKELDPELKILSEQLKKAYSRKR